MSKTIVIDPITRISGFLDIKTIVDENKIINAETSGLLYRGFEKMLKGRHPLDAIYFTERICGICSTAHGMASTLALENALNISPEINDIYIRNMMHGFEFMQNHLRHFYQFIVPSYVKLPEISPISPQEYTDFRIPEALNKKISEDYIESIKYSRLAHEGLAVLGAKAPHTHGIFVGGVTVNIDSYKIEKVKSIITEIYDFITSHMLEDAYIISKYYSDYFKMGMSYPNFMSYGVFDNFNDTEITYVKPGISIEGKKYIFEPDKISEHIHYSWYISDVDMKKPGIEYNEEVDIDKKGAYTFIKAPRYNGLPMEVGPLARMTLSGEYKGGNSTMDRIIARVLEAKKIAEIVKALADRVELKANNQRVYNIPNEAIGVGLIDTTRGALGHWVKIENKVIKNYDIITPTMWNLSPMDEKGVYGVAEKALIGTVLKDVNQPVEMGRIGRSFDPCVSCAVH